jgi:hypothetical protein
LPNECEYSISANLGLTYREDLEPRMRKIEFAFFEEDENKRTFENEFLHEWVKNNRIRILSAIHSCYHYWIDRGMPLGQTPFTSFPRWARIVGGVMICCGLDDPCLPHESKDIIGGDLRAAAMRQLFRLCYEKWQDEWIRKTDIYQVLLDHQDNDALYWFGELDDKRKFTTKLGIALSSFQNRVLDGIRLVIDTSFKNSQAWTYQFKTPHEPSEPFSTSS